MKKILLLFFILFFNGLIGQSISGNFSKLPNQKLKLESFEGLKTYFISNTTIDEKGNFKLTCDNSDFGVGYFIQIRKII
jgi:hypothetical protein